MPRLRAIDRPPPLHHTVQAALKQFIVEHGLRAGDPLPPESSLAQQLGIGRNSVREGVKALESLGVLEVRRGVGAFVKAFTLDPLLENLPLAYGEGLRDVQDVLQIRKALETSLIDDVVAAITPEHIAQLRSIVAAMGAKASQGLAFPDEDRAFHRALFATLENTMLLGLIETFWRIFYKVSGWSDLQTHDPMATYRDHLAILDAVAAGDAKAARRQLDRHYSGVASRLEQRRRELQGDAT